MIKIKIDIVILAAGSSRRFGFYNKLLYSINGKQMFEYTVDNAVKLKNKGLVNNIIAVSKYDEIKSYCLDRDIKYIHNNNSQEGIAGSVALGARHSENAILYMVADQPYITISSLENLINSYISNSGNIVCASDAKGRLLNPCIFPGIFRDELVSLRGDKGGKQVINRHWDIAIPCLFSDNELRDIDYSFPFMDERGHIISIVGAGGKTSIMYFLAEEFAKKGHKTLVTTTTHIYKPHNNYARNKAEILALWNDNKYAVTGELSEDNKLKFNDNIYEYINIADTVLIEADGAKGYPLKIPDYHEPVILDESDIVIGIAGMDCIDRELKYVCHRYKLAEKYFNLAGNHIVNKYDICNILTSEYGTRKNVGNRDYYIVLNKCDIHNGKEVMDLLKGENVCLIGK